MQTLFARANSLTSISESFCESPLVTFDLASNELEVLPSCLGRMSTLGSMAFDQNKLTVLPDSLGHMSTLTYLSVKGNKLKVLPNLAGLAQLRHLSLQMNEFTAVPTALRTVPRQHLQWVNLRGNQIVGTDALRKSEGGAEDGGAKGVKVFLSGNPVCNASSGARVLGDVRDSFDMYWNATCEANVSTHIAYDLFARW